jgi:hypothetical protein
MEDILRLIRAVMLGDRFLVAKKDVKAGEM